ncbi:hypothetical protein SELMODRAFT_128027 [Selaginella moellendorffii]|uniref:Aminotransferase class V domain-containing protein n=1 Tax=Selaginella moellendorffii TaxID=88036 RepID=D8SYJ6_SELML|nr:uncharacterized protein LOC9637087 [Selaginella moellendorffii]XP_024518059.1 uncharacterized protein LOC9637087 [Selaginella moellendorffii]EFJ10534.1 hypothetical protein SELMODRAFT_128027 [Selaginella moellendorffii]|eukprot:XP_002988444.1 uncharacterized protein LOC9637087 [Selaginella moellendorffii]
MRCFAPKSASKVGKVTPSIEEDWQPIFKPNPFKFFRPFDDEQKCVWLRSQIIGSQLQISTPFGSRLLTYADYTASGRCLFYIENFLIKQVMPSYGNTHAEDSYVGEKTTRMVKLATSYVKESLGGTEDDALFFCGSGTTAAVKKLHELLGLSVPPQMRESAVAAIDDRKRWLVFIGPYEHHSNLLPWRQSLAEVIQVPMTEDGLIDMKYLEEELQNPKHADRPMLGSFSACSNVTGVLADTRAIARLLHKHGALACFDFASCGPYVKIDMRSRKADGYDAVMLSPHKYVGGPGTPGLLCMNKKLYKLKDHAPSTTGGGVVDFVNYNKEDTLYLEDIESREDAGTPSILQRIKAGIVFTVQEEMGYRLIESREHNFITTALKRLSKNRKIVVLGNKQVKRAAIVSFVVWTTDSNGGIQQTVLQGRFVAKLLNDLFGIQSRGGCSCAGPYGHKLLKVSDELSLKFRAAIQEGYSGVKPGWTRLNFAYFLSKEEFHFLLCAIEFVADYGQRFLPLYEFEWQTGNWKYEEKNSINTTAKATLHKEWTKLPLLQQHKDYLGTAMAIAKQLAHDPGQSSTAPAGIDPELVTFRF